MRRRGPYTGVQQIWQYNRPFYLLTLAGLAVALFISAWVPPWPRRCLVVGSAAAFIWSAASLAVSHYIYDHSGLYDFSWMKSRLKGTTLVNIHAGLDETSDLIQAQFPEAQLRIFDIFESRDMPEPSILRARQLAASDARTEAVHWRELPVGADQCGGVFLIFAAHELRSQESRVVFFRELRRIAIPGGTLILIEHLRDLPNLLAFGPGFLHFFGRGDWLQVARGAGWNYDSEFPITPFVRAFLFRKSV